MRKIEELIKEYCAQHLPPEPRWIAFLNRRLPQIAVRFDAVRPLQLEIEDHLQSSFEASLADGQSPENAWKHAREQFGDLSLLSREISRSRNRSEYCLLIRLMALALLVALPPGNSPLPFPQRFIDGKSLSYMAACILLGFVLTRRRDRESIRKFAFCGAWLALLWGIVQAIAIEIDPASVGSVIALMIMAAFYGLFLAAPSTRGWKLMAMFSLCQTGVLIALIRSGIVSMHAMRLDFTLWPMVGTASVTMMIVGFMVFDLRKLTNRLAGLAGFGMFYSYCAIMQQLRLPVDGLSLTLATSIPFLVAAIFMIPIRKIQNCLLEGASAKIIL